MKNTPLDAHRASLKTIIFGPMNLQVRRGIATKSLRKAGRLSDQSMFDHIRHTCEGIAIIEYFGHPSRRMAIAYPLQGLNETRETLRSLGVSQGSISCGNYIFSLASVNQLVFHALCVEQSPQQKP